MAAKCLSFLVGSDTRALTRLLIVGSVQGHQVMSWSWGNDWAQLGPGPRQSGFYLPSPPPHPKPPAFPSTAHHRKGLYSHIFSRIKLKHIQSVLLSPLTQNFNFLPRLSFGVVAQACEYLHWAVPGHLALQHPRDLSQNRLGCIATYSLIFVICFPPAAL